MPLRTKLNPDRTWLSWKAEGQWPPREVARQATDL